MLPHVLSYLILLPPPSRSIGNSQLLVALRSLDIAFSIGVEWMANGSLHRMWQVLVLLLLRSRDWLLNRSFLSFRLVSHSDWFVLRISILRLNHYAKSIRVQVRLLRVHTSTNCCARRELPRLVVLAHLSINQQKRWKKQKKTNQTQKKAGKMLWKRKG